MLLLYASDSDLVGVKAKPLSKPFNNRHDLSQPTSTPPNPSQQAVYEDDCSRTGIEDPPDAIISPPQQCEAQLLALKVKGMEIRKIVGRR